MNNNDPQDEQEQNPDQVDGRDFQNGSDEVISAVVVEPPQHESEAEKSENDAAEPASYAAKMRAGGKMAEGKVLDFDPGALDVAVGDTVVVNNDRDLNLGKICYILPNDSSEPLKRVARKIGSHDVLLMRRNSKREEEAFEYCNKRIAERNLPMKLVRAAFLHGGNKAIFFFTADGRVDFRALVRDLAQQLHVRIEMRQIGVRDEARLLGGVGICGQALCCSRYLRKFIPVSIKMAKNQGLALNPQKVSGLCGRLMCCLVYEDETYSSLRKEFPRQGKTIDTPVGPGRVLDSDVLASKIRVSTESGLHTFTKKELEQGPVKQDEKSRKEAEDEARAAARQEQDDQRGNKSRKRQPSPKASRGRTTGNRENRKTGEESRSGSSRKRRRKKKASGAEGAGGASSNSAVSENKEKSGGAKKPESGDKSSSKKRRPRRRSRRRRRRKSPATESGQKADKKES